MRRRRACESRVEIRWDGRKKEGVAIGGNGRAESKEWMIVGLDEADDDGWKEEGMVGEKTVLKRRRWEM